MWNRFKRVNYFVDDLSWGEVSETIVDNIEKLQSVNSRQTRLKHQSNTMNVLMEFIRRSVINWYVVDK